MNLDPFFSVMEKQAVSAGRTLAVLRARMAQGGRVAPKLLQQAESAAASGLSSTPAAARRAALGAGEGARLAQKAQAYGANPITQSARARGLAAYERGVAGGPGVRGKGQLSSHYDYGATAMAGESRPYTKAHAESLFTSRQVKDTVGQSRRLPSIQSPTPPAGSSAVSAVGQTQVAPTVLAKRPERVTAIAKRRRIPAVTGAA